ncbi:MAG TPA: hypothetical protein VFY71_00715 [Planctomycetota bacterium]|nr:hypothetical protein [Planctomycetota bacterium]
MPCVIVLVLLGLPRVAVLCVGLFSHYFEQAFSYPIWPFLGFLFAPLTTLTYAWAHNTYGSVQGVGLAVVIVAALFDLGLVGAARRRRSA